MVVEVWHKTCERYQPAEYRGSQGGRAGGIQWSLLSYWWDSLYRTLTVQQCTVQVTLHLV